MFFFHHKTVAPKPRYGGFLYGLLILAFAVITLYAPVVGLIGVGSLLLLAGIFVEVNADRVWQESMKWQKKNRKNVPWWNRPTPFFYAVNIYVLWPLIILMGIFALVLAYRLVGLV
jgi:ABC-type antimicrobial peptide transport system permease subunit